MIEDTHALSFRNYKINYNRCLGFGCFGTVYEVVERPENEKGCLSYVFPYIYDYIFPVEEKKQTESPYCVKISKCALSILLERGSVLAKHSLWEPVRQRETNKVARKYGLSNVKIYKTNSLYSQFKTKVNGHTFSYYLTQFWKKEGFELRKSFVDFLRLIANPKIYFLDLHPGNLMYDRHEQRWNIIDGTVQEIDSLDSLNLNSNNILRLKKQLMSGLFYGEEILECILDILAETAKSNESYTKEIDQRLLDKVNYLVKIRREKQNLLLSMTMPQETNIPR